MFVLRLLCLAALVFTSAGVSPARAKDLLGTAQDAGTFTILLGAVKST